MSNETAQTEPYTETIAFLIQRYRIIVRDPLMSTEAKAGYLAACAIADPFVPGDVAGLQKHDLVERIRQRLEKMT